jgi:hypothetical protein
MPPATRNHWKTKEKGSPNRRDEKGDEAQRHQVDAEGQRCYGGIDHLAGDEQPAVEQAMPQDRVAHQHPGQQEQAGAQAEMIRRHSVIGEPVGDDPGEQGADQEGADDEGFVLPSLLGRKSSPEDLQAESREQGGDQDQQAGQEKDQVFGEERNAVFPEMDQPPGRAGRPRREDDAAGYDFRRDPPTIRGQGAFAAGEDFDPSAEGQPEQREYDFGRREGFQDVLGGMFRGVEIDRREAGKGRQHPEKRQGKGRFAPAEEQSGQTGEQQGRGAGIKRRSWAGFLLSLDGFGPGRSSGAGWEASASFPSAAMRSGPKCPISPASARPIRVSIPRKTRTHAARRGSGDIPTRSVDRAIVPKDSARRRMRRRVGAGSGARTARVSAPSMKKTIDIRAGLFYKSLRFRESGVSGENAHHPRSPVAQSVEQVAVNHLVRGSSPRWGAKNPSPSSAKPSCETPREAIPSGSRRLERTLSVGFSRSRMGKSDGRTFVRENEPDFLRFPVVAQIR